MTKKLPTPFPRIAWLSLLLASIALLLSLYQFSVAQQSAVVTLDTDRLAHHLVRRVQHEAKTPAAARQLSRQLTTASAKLVREYAATHAVVIFRASDTLAGANDITDTIIHGLDAALPAGSPSGGKPS